MSDTEDAYAETLDADLHEIRGALFDDTLAVLSPPDPICLGDTVSVQDAVDAPSSPRRTRIAANISIAR